MPATEQLRAAYLRHSDLGDAAAELLDAQRPAPPLTVDDVAATFRAIAAAGTADARVGLMEGLFRAATSGEARYIGRIAARETRIGLREGLLEEGIAAAFEVPLEEVRRAHMLVADPGEAAVLARHGRLDEAHLRIGRPIRFMLATPVADATEVMRRVGDEAWIEDKYDGIRAQLHRDDAGAVRLFSRDLNDVSRAFPEVIAAGETALRAPTVIDGELVPWREGSVLDFAVAPDAPRPGRPVPGAPRAACRSCSSRSTCSTTPEATCIETPLRVRRAALERLGLPERERRSDPLLPPRHGGVGRPRSSGSSTTRASGTTRASWSRTPRRSYQPGRRGLGWLKLKKALATLDCVVVGRRVGPWQADAACCPTTPSRCARPMSRARRCSPSARPTPA